MEQIVHRRPACDCTRWCSPRYDHHRRYLALVRTHTRRCLVVYSTLVDLVEDVLGMVEHLLAMGFALSDRFSSLVAMLVEMGNS